MLIKRIYTAPYFPYIKWEHKVLYSIVRLNKHLGTSTHIFQCFQNRILNYAHSVSSFLIQFLLSRALAHSCSLSISCFILGVNAFITSICAVFCTFLTSCSGVNSADAEIKGPPLIGAQGCERFPLSKPGVHQNIALHAAPANLTSTYILSVFPIHSTDFFFTHSSDNIHSNVYEQ